MFSDINKIMKPFPTASDPKTAESDARQEIIRHDPDQERKKQHKDKDTQEDSLFGDDQTDVSVESLTAFLKMLLKEYVPQPARDKMSVSERSSNVRASATARAAGAYERTSHFQHPEEVSLPEIEVAEEDRTNPTLSSREVQRIVRLQKQVKHLLDRHIYSLRIEPAETFLDSLEKAVDDALK